MLVMTMTLVDKSVPDLQAGNSQLPAMRLPNLRASQLCDALGSHSAGNASSPSSLPSSGLSATYLSSSSSWHHAEHAREPPEAPKI